MSKIISNSRFPGVIFLVLAALSLWGCSSLRESYTQWPAKDLEKMIAGRLDADYVGTDTCVAKCHAHDRITRDFKMSIHGEQVSSDTGLPLVNCESCHGPGSLALENIQKETCDFSTFIQINDIAPEAQSLICLKCHSARSLQNLATWGSSEHAVAGVSCFDCHQLHKGPGQKVKESEIVELCLDCHQEKKALFSLPSRHPVLEKKMTCYDCHDPHGSTLDYDLRTASIKELCTRCHAHKRGPFAFEHGSEAYDDCRTCHNPHGSVNGQLKKYNMPFICLQCHNGHNATRHPGLATQETKITFFTNCAACHARHHGTNFIGFRNDGRYIR